ncbi:MAG: L-ribulose-5-phosphate 4-epimerase [Candidatus Sumerlaeota bacterium]|nr:L-ribulose-5-phosphate 4-epimerase [Candidatus Sumerlaeota bacterium]
MAHEELKEIVWQANMGLARAGLAPLTWGNASGVDRKAGVMAIKPSGVEYDQLRPEDIVILALDTGEVIEGKLKPSSDAPTHRLLYQSFKSIGGVVHTHSPHATSWAQAGREIPCFGTTHADHFYGPVPLTRLLTSAEIKGDYEWNTGVVIVERFEQARLNPDWYPGVLVAGHGPFTWGANAIKALHNAVALEEMARMALQTLALNPAALPISQELLDKHFLRKHGTRAYYGQKASVQND